MAQRLRLLYASALVIMALSVSGGTSLGAWTCCTATKGQCSGEQLCCDPEKLEACYDTWWPFDQIDGYCMTFEQCVQVN